jgi:diguanylate cyclase (GGDEF)-like protein/PAS domain S-box-containing protein
VAMFTITMATETAFILLTVVLVVLGVCLRNWRQYRAKMRAKAQQDAIEREAHLDEAGSHLALAVQGTQDGLWYWDLKTNTFRFSSGWETLLGFEKGELSKDPEEWFSRVHHGYRAELQGRITAHLQGESEQFRYEHRMRRKDGSYFWVSARATVTRNTSGEALGLAGSHSDITALIPVERQLLDDAFHDKLTGLPNRHFFMGRLDTAVEQRRQEGNGARLFAVMFLDLDRFKNINDTLGHQVGDQLLTCVARRLQNCVGPSDMVARLGGDEFVILLECVEDAQEALRVGARISDALASPFQIEGSEVPSGASIGIALSRERFDTTEDLVRLADLAMYHSKTQRKGRPELFHERMKEQPIKSLSHQSELARAIKQKEFLLDYQPYFDIQSGRILGVEALIRWQPENLVLSPSDFIPLAEETGLIHDIGDWVLRTACAQSSAWQRAGIPPVQIAVNVAAKQLQKADFTQKVVTILEEARLAPQWLNLELTESALMDTYKKAPGTLERLDKLGIGTSIDDFGTGYSSLNYLRRFNFQTLKLDRCFVSDISTNQKAAAIVKGLISLAHNLGISVIAEGVERHDQLRLLASENCDQVQGFLTGRPVAPDQMLRLLRSVNVKEQSLHLTGGARRNEYAQAAPIIQLSAMVEEYRNSIQPRVESKADSIITLAGG